jgi:hypothetical protein
MGISRTGWYHLQIVAFPRLPYSAATTMSDSLQQDTEFVLAVDIPLLSPIPTEPNLPPVLCHTYTGRHKNRLSIWIRENDWIPSWLIFDVDLDLRNPPERWLVPRNDDDSENDHNASRLAMPGPKRIVDAYNATHWALPLADGKRFLSAEGLADPLKPFNGGSKVFISMYEISTVPSIGDMPEFDKKFDAQAYHREQCSRYQKRSFECPIDYTREWDNAIPGVNSFAFEEWSGTAVVLMTNGDIWVLRYGHQ